MSNNININSFSKSKSSGSGGGSASKTIFVNSANLETVTKLATKRKIWGHDFDGTQDVEGDFFAKGSWTVLSPYTDKSITRFIPGQRSDGLSRWIWRHCNVELHDGKITIGKSDSTHHTEIGFEKIYSDGDLTIKADGDLALEAYSMTQKYEEGHLDLGIKGDLKAGSVFTNNIYDYGAGQIYVGSPLLLDGGLDLNGDLTVKNLYSQTITNDQDIRTKNLTVTGQMTVFDLVIAEISAAGGNLILSAADFRIDAVEDGRTNVPNEHHFGVVGNGWIDGTYRTKYIYQIAEDSDGQKIDCKWKPFDQIISYTSNVSEDSAFEMRSWWTLVLSVETNVNHLINNEVRPCHRLEIVEAIKDPEYSTGGVVDNDWHNPSWGVCNPMIGDNCALLGSQHEDRQSAIMLSAYDTIDLRLKAPCIAQYEHIVGFELPEATTYFSRAGNRISGTLVTNSGKSITEIIDSVVKGRQTYMHRAWSDSEDGSLNFTKTKDREYAFEGLASNMTSTDTDLVYSDYIWMPANSRDKLLPTRERLYLSEDDCLYLDVEYLTDNWTSNSYEITAEIFTYGGAVTTRRITDRTNDGKRLRYAGLVQKDWSAVQLHAMQYCAATVYLKSGNKVIDSRSFQMIMDAGAIVSITDKIAARVSDSDGNVNTLVMTARMLMQRITSLDSSLQFVLNDNSANLRIDAIDGRVNDIMITVDGLSAKIEGAEEYDDDWIRKRLAEYEINLDGIRASLSSISQSVYDDTWIVKKFNDFQVTVDGLQESLRQVEVSGYDDSEINEKISNLEHTIDGLKVDVQNIKTWGDEEEVEEGQLAVMANQIYAKITNNMKTTGIDITNGRIELDAEKTDILGMLNIKDNYDSGIILYKNGSPILNIVPDDIGSFDDGEPAMSGRISRSDLFDTWSSWSGSTSPVSIGQLAKDQKVAFNYIFVYMYALKGGHFNLEMTKPSGNMTANIKIYRGSTKAYDNTWTLTDTNASGTGWKVPATFDFTATAAGEYKVTVTLTSATTDAVISDARLRIGCTIEYEKNGQSGTMFGQNGIRINSGSLKRVYAGNGTLYVQNEGVAFGVNGDGPRYGELQRISASASSGSFQTDANEYKMRWFSSYNFRPVFYASRMQGLTGGPDYVYKYKAVEGIGKSMWCWQIDPFKHFGDCMVIDAPVDSNMRSQEPWILLPPARGTDSSGHIWHLPIGWRVTIYNAITPDQNENQNVRVCVEKRIHGGNETGKTFLDSNLNWNTFCCLDGDLNGRSSDTYIFMGSYWLTARDTQ